MKLMSIPLSRLQPHPKRDNVMLPEQRAKLKENMRRSGQTEPVTAYQDPDLPKGTLTIVNGHIRCELAQELGWECIGCFVLKATPAEAELALATFNTLRGTPDPEKRMSLIASLHELFPLNELQLLLPESNEALADMLALKALDEAKAEKAFQEALEAERQALPVTLTFVVSLDEKALIEATLECFDAKERSVALVALCQAWMKGQHNG